MLQRMGEAGKEGTVCVSPIHEFLHTYTQIEDLVMGRGKQWSREHTLNGSYTEKSNNKRLTMQWLTEEEEKGFGWKIQMKLSEDK